VITIKPVITSQDKQSFINIPKQLYKNDPHWIAPLDIMVHDQLNPKKNPIFEKLEAQFWIAYENNVPIGRISAQINQLHLKYQNKTEGHFGFLEANSIDTMQQLIDTAKSWLSNKGMTKISGPFNLCINEESGLLIDGFNTPPYLMMGHHKPEYQEWITSLGFSKAKDLLALTLDLTHPFSKKWSTLVKRAKTANIKTHKINMRNYSNEVESAFTLFNAAWKNNWGFIPIEKSVVNHIKSEFKYILNPNFCINATKDNKKIGVMYALPNINEALHDLNGSLLPWGWLKLLFRLKIKSPKTGRVVLGGIDPEIQNTALGGYAVMLLIDHIAKEGRKKGIQKVESSWVLEDNNRLLKVLDLLDLKVYKRYRIFSKVI
jgi:hypothetical protein